MNEPDPGPVGFEQEGFGWWVLGLALGLPVVVFIIAFTWVLA